jgi:guanylate kinase
MSENGILVILSGPSGVGKTTVIGHLVRTGAFLESISATTRKPRVDEKDGVHYHFLAPEEFDRRVRAGEFLEHAVVHGEKYGTLRAEVDRILRTGRHCVMSIDVQGARQIREKGVPALLLFLVAPDMATLEQRLRDRNTDSEEEIRSRLRTAREEMKRADRYDRVIVNRVAEEAAREVRAAVEELRDTIEEA